MNIRCAFCQTPYTLSRVAMLDALQEVDSQNLTHYDAHCPRCRRATRCLCPPQAELGGLHEVCVADRARRRGDDRL